MISMRLSDLVVVLEALIPHHEVSVDGMLVVLAQLRKSGRIVEYDTSPAAFVRLAEAVGLTALTLEDALRQAPPSDRARFKRELVRPEHQGCTHLRTQLERGVHGAALLQAWVTARWYGWPGLRLRRSDEMVGFCCCGAETTPTARDRARPRLRAMTANDI